MEKIKNSVLIASGIIKIRKPEITLEEIINYSKQISSRLKDTNYCRTILNSYDIMEFFNYYPYIGNIKQDKIILNKKNIRKISEFFLSDIPDDLKMIFDKTDKYIFPIVLDDKLINYHFISNDNILNKIKSKLYYDNKNNSYILDLENIKSILGEENLISFIKELFDKEKIIKKDILDYKSLLNIIEHLDLIKKQNFENINYFDESNLFSKVYLMSDIIFNYCYIANKNKINIEGNTNKLTYK